jgi:hypothetical protein
VAAIEKIAIVCRPSREALPNTQIVAPEDRAPSASPAEPQ